MICMSLTMVKNEELIIESFVRYNMKFLNKMIIIDNGCTDHTIDILWKLKEEGYDIEIFNESFIDYEQLLIENKYMYKIIDEYKADWIIPLDADEFIDTNDQNFFEKLNPEKNYSLYWKTYIVTDYDNEDEVFIPRKMCYCIKPVGENDNHTVTKVIVSGKLICKQKIYFGTGHHSLVGNEQLKLELLEDCFIAHYPLISKEHLFIKILGSYCNFIPWMTRGMLAKHVNINRFNIEESEEYILKLMSGGYCVGCNNLSEYEKIYNPLQPLMTNDIVIKYTPDKQIDMAKYFFYQNEIMGIKLFMAKRKKYVENVPRVLVYGTGKSAADLFDDVEENCVDVLAYIDSDREKQYLKFHHSLIIFPDKIKFFDYEKIIIASVFFDEIKQILLKYHVREEDIVDSSYLVELSLHKI